MLIVGNIFDALDRWAPFSTAIEMDGFVDNVGLLIGNRNHEVNRVGIALDLTTSVIEQAIAQDIDLLISHHPVIFSPIKRIDFSSPIGLLTRHGIAAICAHTNLDGAKNGVSALLAEKAGLLDIQPLGDPKSPNDLSLARVGHLPSPMTTHDFSAMIRENLSAKAVQYNSGKTQKISTIAVCSGGGSSFLDAAIASGADAFLTGEVSHHHWLAAKEVGIALITAGHYVTEQICKKQIKNYLCNLFSDLSIICMIEQEPFFYSFAE